MLMKINGLVRLAKEPEIKYLPSGVSVTSFTIVGSEKYKDNEFLLKYIQNVKQVKIQLFTKEKWDF